MADVHPIEHDATRRELREIAERHGMLSYRLLADVLDVQAAARQGLVKEYRRILDEARALAGTLGLGQAGLAAERFEAGLACMTGDYRRAAERYRSVADVLQRHDGVRPEGFVAEALFAVHLGEGRLADIVDVVRARYRTMPDMWGPPLACCLAAAGEHAEARAVLTAVSRSPFDPRWRLSRSTALARAGVMLEDDTRAPILYSALLPYRDQIAGAASGFPHEPIAYTLATLAVQLGKPDDAEHHLALARDIADRCTNVTWLTRIDATLPR
jgi:hypothetical protein